MTALDTALADYLGVRRAVGYELRAAGRHLESFVAHLNRSGIETVTVTAAVDWATQTATATCGGGAKRLSAVRGFARYLQALDPAHEVPPTRLLPARATRPVPHLFHDADIDALMFAAGGLTPTNWACTVKTMIGLLWATGMRSSEVIALNDADVDADQAVLTVWFSKFNKSRHVPVSASTMDALDRYNTAVHPPGPALFCGRDGAQRISYAQFKAVFDRLIDSVGITTNNGTRPRLHNMRHSFATRTLLGWYRDGADVHALLPRLSTYLGHVEPSSTYWYLSAAPELMALAAARLEANEVKP